MKIFKSIIKFVPVLILGFGLGSCEKDGSLTSDFETVNYNIAVVLPLSDSEQKASYLDQTDRFMQKLANAQVGLDTRIALNLEWHDEDSENMETLSRELTDREDITAVIGAQHSVNTRILANAMNRKKKTLISTQSTSVELARTFAGKKFYWALSETDITQCELLLHMAKESYYTDKVSLVAPSDIYGQSFIDWTGFIAAEMGMTVEGIYQYDPQTESSEQAYLEAFSKSDGLVICVPGDISDVATAVSIRSGILKNRVGKDMTPAQMYTMKPYIVFSDAANVNSLLSMPDSIKEFTVGVSIGTDPQSGFDIDSQLRYGTPAKATDALFHDALLLLSLGLRELTDGTANNLNDAIMDVVSTHDAQGNALDKVICFEQSCMTTVMQDLARGTKRYDISGVSSNLDFDKDQYTTVVHSIYDQWCVYDGQFQIISKLSSDGSGRTEKSLAAWNLKTSNDLGSDDFPVGAPVLNYGIQTDAWALLIAASTGWSNFRHQADVMSIYHKLRKLGYPDDHIVLILADDMADNPRNPQPGTVPYIDGTDLYKGIQIDYRLSELEPSDISSILSGNRQERLPHVIEADSTQNILVFWSGHGQQGYFCWDENDEAHSFNKVEMSKLLKSLSQNRKYRKMLWLIETCFSASVACSAQENDIPGVMMITAANANETSKTYYYSSDLGTWMTNRFTMNLMQAVDENPGCSYLELYKGLTRQTTGSHVTIINNRNFDNLYMSSIGEFFKYSFK